MVFIIAPWNYPYLTTINTLAPALIAGNTVVLKHATQTLLVGERLAEAFHAAGVPEDVFQNVVLDHATTEALIARAVLRLRQLHRLGRRRRGDRTRGGGHLHAAGAGTGRQGPGLSCCRMPTWTLAVDGLMDGAMYNAGQCCCGIERIYVHESLFDSFVEKSVAWVGQLKLGNPFDASTTLGPMANKRFAADGARPDRRGHRRRGEAADRPGKQPADDGGAYLAPQILVNVDHSMRVMKEESFGPVVGIMPVQDRGRGGAR